MTLRFYDFLGNMLAVQDWPYLPRRDDRVYVVLPPGSPDNRDSLCGSVLRVELFADHANVFVLREHDR